MFNCFRNSLKNKVSGLQMGSNTTVQVSDQWRKNARVPGSGYLAGANGFRWKNAGGLPLTPNEVGENDARSE